ncbi:MAG TPA: DUF2933 domain-containing protein [Alphaproteobacteria bacterium]|jgi:hypothetical protein
MHENQHHDANGDERKSFWRTPLGWAFLGFAAIAAFFLVTEHTAHVFGVLPWLLILACPLMHIFMHRGHGHGGHDHGGAKNAGERDATPAQRGK